MQALSCALDFGRQLLRVKPVRWSVERQQEERRQQQHHHNRKHKPRW